MTRTSPGRVKWAYAVDLGGNVWRISGADANTQFGVTPPGNWHITQKSDPYIKTDAQTIEFRIPVKAGEESVLNYTVRYTW